MKAHDEIVAAFDKANIQGPMRTIILDAIQDAYQEGFIDGAKEEEETWAHFEPRNIPWHGYG